MTYNEAKNLTVKAAPIKVSVPEAVPENPKNVRPANFRWNMNYVIQEQSLGYSRFLAGFSNDGLAVWKRDTSKIVPFRNRNLAHTALLRAGEGDLKPVELIGTMGNFWPGKWRLVGLLLLCLFSVGAQGAWLQWDHNPVDEGVIGYHVLIGTNSGNYGSGVDVGYTNSWLISRFTIPRGPTNFFTVTAYSASEESEHSNEVFVKWPSNPTPPITNVTLRVPSGKFYVEQSGNSSVWLAPSVVTGPTNMTFAISGVMGFCRYRPYFVSAASPKPGQLTKMKAAAMKKKPVKAEPVPQTIGPINLIPPTR